MNGIDTAIASVLTSRVDSLLGIQPGSAATSQTGATGVANAPTTAPPAATPRRRRPRKPRCRLSR